MFEYCITKTCFGKTYTSRGLEAANEQLDELCPEWAGHLTWDRDDDQIGRRLVAYLGDKQVAEIRDVGVEVEYMPEHHRQSHIAAGNRGIYPHNGALRIDMHRDDVEDFLAEHGDWAHVVG